MQGSALRRKRHPLRVVDLRVGALYVSPRGRLCRLLPHSALGPGSDTDVFSFCYLGLAGDDQPDDGFSIASANVGLLREWGL